MSRRVIITILITIGLILITVFNRGFYATQESVGPSQNTDANSKNVMVLSTNPDNLDNATILPTQSLEITFNKPVENEGELKHRLEPQTDHHIEVSGDRKTVKVVPNKGWALGTTYTLFIQSDSKFREEGKLDHEIIYHFKTIDYKGI
jgi:hypothetical protein